MSKKIKVKFVRDYSPRKKGEVIELKQKLAEFYLNNGIAERTDVSAAEKGGCKDCNKAEEVAEKLATANEALEAKEIELTTVTEKVTELETSIVDKDAELATANEALEEAKTLLDTANENLKIAEATIVKLKKKA